MRDIGRLAHEAGLRTFIAGGCVRDLVLGRRVKDVDIAVVGDALVLAHRFASVAGGTIIVYKQFGTATVTLNDGSAVDFATLRKESYPYPGALPVVSSGSLEEDLFRRDFTINAMAIAINPVEFGRLIDLYGGQNDLKGKVIRVMHDKSFLDDPTRILRAVRFEQRFGFHIEPATERLLRGALGARAFDSLKPPRLFEEFKKNLKESAVLANVKRLQALGALSFFGEKFFIGAQRSRMFRKAAHGLRWGKNNLLDVTDQSVWLVYWMILCDSMPSAKIARMMDRTAFRSVDKDKVLNAISSVKILNILEQDKLTASQTFLLLRSKSPEELIYLGVKSSKTMTFSRIRAHLLKWRHVSLKINGDDLKRSGIPSGKIFKEILDEVLCRVVDGRLRLRSQQLAYVQSLFQHNQR